MAPASEVPQRSDAQRNRARILAVALAELSRSADVPLSVIAKKAGVGQGTFYRNFPDREALVLEVHRQEVQQLVDGAAELLRTLEPGRALRAWLDLLARYVTAKPGLADALRRATAAAGAPAKPGYPLLVAAIDLLLKANHDAGTIRPGVTSDDLVLAIAGVWQLDPQGDWEPRAARLFDLVMRGLRTGAPGRR
ncbi:TetR/AcrR family transcriptional regulator [Streptomyces bottropensis]|uniref:TetR/AcrR family transcriptional regulator n=1 Tax=Streptomyces bottropensis TaxID=42235 RepID=UPI0037A84337